MTAARPRPRGWLLSAATVAAAIGAALLVLVIAPELQARHTWLAMAASFAPYGWPAWLVAVVLALVACRGRARWMALPLAVGLVAHSFVVLPYLPLSTSVAAGGSELGVLALNLRFGLADLTELASAVDRQDPDIVVLTEVTTHAATAFRGKEWRRRLPHQVGRAGRDFDPATGAGDASGTMVLSRYPLTELARSDDMTFTNLAVRVALPTREVTVVAAHPVNPTYGVEKWVRDGQLLAQLAGDHAGGPLIVAGDLNATAEHLTLRNLVSRLGLTDATRGWAATFPAEAWYPPLLQIDHVLVSKELAVVGQGTVRVRGTDHRGLLVRLVLA